MSLFQQPFQGLVEFRPSVSSASLPFRVPSQISPETPEKNDPIASYQHGESNEVTERSAVLQASPIVEINELFEVDPLIKMKNFSLFPIEIRHTIWHLSSSDPRVIEIAGYLRKNCVKSKVAEMRLSSNALAPAIMHACVDSRNAGKRFYKPLILNKFTGTYVNWSVDYVMFNKTTTGRSLEDIYMTYEGKIPQPLPHFDLVLNVQRLAVSPYHLNDFIRVASDSFGEIDKEAPGLVLVYPSLKEVAVVECWKCAETETQNMGIQPKQVIPYEPPEYFCPQTNLEPTAEGMVIVLNRWHQPCTWMRVVPQGGKLLTIKQKPKPATIFNPPKVPRRLPGLSRHTATKLRSLCKKRNLDQTGTRDTLTDRLHDDEAANFPLTEEQYKQDLRKWAGIMLGHAEPPSGTDFSDEVKVARAKDVTNWLANKGYETTQPTV